MPVVIGPPNYSPQDQVFQDWLRRLQEQRRQEEERKRQEEAAKPGWQGGLGAAGTAIGALLAAPTGGMSMVAGATLGGAIGGVADVGASYAMPGGGSGGGGPSAVIPQVNRNISGLVSGLAAQEQGQARQQFAMQMAQQKQLMQQAQSVNRTMSQVNAEAKQYGTTTPEYLGYLMGDKQMAEVVGKYGDLATANPRQRQLIDEYNGFKAGERHVGGPDTIYSKPQQWEYMQNSLGNRRRIVSELSTSPPPKEPTVPDMLEKKRWQVSPDGAYYIGIGKDGTPKSAAITRPRRDKSFGDAVDERRADRYKESYEVMPMDDAIREELQKRQLERMYEEWTRHRDEGGKLGFFDWRAQQMAPPVGVPMRAGPAPGPVVTPAQMPPPQAPAGLGGGPIPSPAQAAPELGQMPRPQAAQIVQARLDDPQSVPPHVFIDAVRSLFPNPKDVPAILKDEIKRIHRQKLPYDDWFFSELKARNPAPSGGG